MQDRSLDVLRGLLVATIAISIVHYTDNTIRWDVYTGGEDSLIPRWMVPVGWVIFTLAGIAGYVAFRDRRFSRSARWLSLCAVGGLVDPFHFTTVSPSDFDAYELVFIWADFVVGGLGVLAFAVWVALNRAPREASA
jgi:hypothetical protein